MDATVAGLIGAAIGAVAGFTGTVLTVVFQFRLEERKWLRNREDLALKELRVAIAELTKTMSSAMHSMTWLTWTAYEELGVIDKEIISSYDVEMHKLFPELWGILAVIAALDKETHSRLEPFVEEITKNDAQIARATLLFKDSDSSECKAALAECFADTKMLYKNLPQVLADSLSTSNIGQNEVRRIALSHPKLRRPFK
ncbi:MAG: hypothetical protein AAF063_22580 [Cyanobacteria bacterium J06643_5]